ncbi:MAG: polysaccharide biosynthesis protein, partial [Clostridia bacterium]|nr:polysaccharide biosynthesis protein [Clostridia bacterium]
RKPRSILDGKTAAYYKGKRVLVTGGGGSIGAELCRILAKMKPSLIVIVDIYENGAYDVRQELKIIYGDEIDVKIEIVSVTNYYGLLKTFKKYKPEVVLHAAAHKHVPLMEENCVEAAYNNVFGTLNTVKCAVESGAERFIMLSTDKAVNPTNVMGATKRLCEMIVAAYAAKEGNTVNFSATRFGNVLGSAGSVVPLFRKQIAYGGPLTVTDKRIIRYFMSISEAASLVLISGAMAASGELFVLDMGEPVKIIELAETMIRLSGLRPYVDIDIDEIGLRPGEKLYEELLLKTENLDKTPNELIFIERDVPHSLGEVEAKLSLLKDAIETGDDAKVKETLMRIVPEYRTPEDVNGNVAKA